MSPAISAPNSFTYLDLFAGCGGLSLGLKNAGWEGMFAIEQSPMAFKTLRHNLIDPADGHFSAWPKWLPKEPIPVQSLTKKYNTRLRSLRGKVMLIAGGPPCQGFSSAGKRDPDDKRNKLYRSYIEVVTAVRPALVMLENVKGITAYFGGKPRKRGRGRPVLPYSVKIERGLEKLGYRMFLHQILVSDYGVPQSRTRFIAIGVDSEQFGLCPLESPIAFLASGRKAFLEKRKFPSDRPVACGEAISDLLYDESALGDSPDSPRFKAGKYVPALTEFEKNMRGSTADGAIVDSHRFVRHTAKVAKRFALIQESCTRGKKISDDDRDRLGIKKECIVPLDHRKPAPTLTTLPDDILHYSQPRILTVREYARLQSFPDWFKFKSKYTTGGTARKKECPRYTQIGNAVPPLFAEALGLALKEFIAAFRAGFLDQVEESGKTARHVA